MGTTPCRSCRDPKAPGMYMCRFCWLGLSSRTRRALNRKDDLAMTRLRELHQQIDGGRSLIDIEVTP